ncbi:hypothetical protein Ae201684_019140, partial [Aphanomyces euteiches]
MREQKSTREEAANAAVSMAKTFDDSIRICGWTVQCWAKHFMHHGAPPTSRRGLHQKTASLIHDEDVVSKCLQWLRLTLPSQRTPFRVQQHRQEHVLPSTTGAIRANVSLRTAERWMNKAGYFYGLAKKDVYIDGHERADVVKQRGEFCQTWIMMSQRMSFYAGENMKEHFAPEDTSQPEVVWITHDESIFYANDNGGKVWLSQSCPDLGKKGRGRSIMVSDFLCPCHGRLHDGKEFVTAILHVGKTHEGYWTSEHAIHQLKSKVLPAFTQLHPGKVAMFTFDQSTNHAAFAPDAWRASNMNLHSGGKQGLLRDGWLASQLVVDRYGLSLRLFSQLAFEKGSSDTSGYINRVLCSLSKEIDSALLIRNLRSHSSRRGAAATAASSSDVNLSDLADRGRWTMDGFNTLLEYISETSASDQKVARALGGWQHPTRNVQRLFTKSLFQHYSTRLKKDSFQQALAASLLLYFPDTRAACQSHVLHTAMIDAVKACDNSKNDEQAVDVLLEWAAAIKKSFISDNMQCLPISTSGAVDFVHSTKISLGDTLARFSSAQRDVAAEITDLSGKLELQNRHHEQVKRELTSLHRNFDQLSNDHRTALNTISAQQNTILDMLSRLTDTTIQLEKRKTPSAADSTLASSLST